MKHVLALCLVQLRFCIQWKCVRKHKFLENATVGQVLMSKMVTILLLLLRREEKGRAQESKGEQRREEKRREEKRREEKRRGLARAGNRKRRDAATRGCFIMTNPGQSQTFHCCGFQCNAIS
jgi:hypothetical protein